MSDPLKLRQVRALIDELIETTKESAQEEIESLRQQLVDSQNREVILRAALVMWLEGSNLSTAIIESEKALAATEPTK